MRSAVVALAIAWCVGGASAQDGAWDVPRTDEGSSPAPSVAPEPVEGREVAATPDDAATPEDGDEARRAALRDALGVLRALAERERAAVLADVEAGDDDRARAEVAYLRTDAAWRGLEALLAGEEAVRATLATDDVTVGEPVELSLVVPYDVDDAAPDVELPGPIVDLVPDAEWTAGRFVGVTSTLAPDGWRLDATVQLAREGDPGLDGLTVDVVVPDLLAAHDLGDLPLGALTVALSPPADVTLDLPPTQVRRVDPQRLPGLDLPMPPTPYAAVLVALFAGLALLGWLARALMPRVVVETAVVVPPERVAGEALADLRARMPRTVDAIPPFVDAVSAVLRRYVEGKFGVAAPDLTTDEFLARAAERHPALAARRDVLQPFLTQCDLVKFAGHRPSLDAPPELLDTAETFVEETRAVDDDELAAAAAPAAGAAA